MRPAPRSPGRRNSSGPRCRFPSHGGQMAPCPIDPRRSGRAGPSLGPARFARRPRPSRPDPRATGRRYPPRPAACASGRPARARRHRRLAVIGPGECGAGHAGRGLSLAPGSGLGPQCRSGGRATGLRPTAAAAPRTFPAPERCRCAGRRGPPAGDRWRRLPGSGPPPGPGARPWRGDAPEPPECRS